MAKDEHSNWVNSDISRAAARICGLLPEWHGGCSYNAIHRHFKANNHYFMNSFQTTALSPVETGTTAFDPRRTLLQNLLELDVQELGFSPPVAAVMHNAHVLTVGELIRQTEPILLRWRGLGRARVAEIKDRLRLLGLTLGMDPEAEPVHPVIEYLALSLAQRRKLEPPEAGDGSSVIFPREACSVPERDWKAG